MDLNLQIQGLGKIDSLSLNIKPLTVIAGENSSGKTFATKSIYCVLEALNQDQLLGTFQQLNKNFLDSVKRYEISLLPRMAKIDQVFIEQLNHGFVEVARKIHGLLSELNLLEQFKLESLLIEEKSQILLLADSIDAYLNKRNSTPKIKNSEHFLRNGITVLFKIHGVLNNSEQAVTEYIARRLSDNFKRNYQVTRLSELINSQKKNESKITIDEIGSLVFSDKNEIFFEFAKQGVYEIQKLNEVVFVDSPVYLRIRQGLQKNPLDFIGSRYDSRDLKGYPEHIDNIYRFVDRRHMDEPEDEFIQLSRELQKTVAGKLVVTKTGEIFFHSEAGNPTPLTLAATGISNLGLLDLLIRNSVIKKGSFLIIDEPEAHIHPKWQVVLMDILYKMASAGVNVIIATHSLDMLKKLQLLVKQDRNSEQLVSVHKMPGSDLEGNATLLDKINEALTDLSGPFYEMYMEDNV